jgi:hypothetical protein
MATQPVQILDPYSRPANYTPSAKWPEGSTSATNKFSRPLLTADMMRMITPQKHRMLVADGRFISTTFPLVGEAQRQKARYVSTGGWDPVFAGEDVEWGKRALAYLKRYHLNCNVRGPLFPWSKMWQLASRFWDHDGDFFIVLVKGRNGFPRFQVLESHRVGQRVFSATVEQKGPYEGATLLNGIVYDDYGKPLAYQVTGARRDADRFIAARNVHHVADPNFFSDGRPWPSVAYAVLDWYDVKLARSYTKTKMQAHSALTMVEKNATGLRRINGVDDTAATDTALATQMLDEGLVRVIRGGEEIVPFDSKTPSAEFQAFDQILVDGAFYGMGWHVGMFDLSRLKGAGVRGFEDQINTTIYERWFQLQAHARRALLWEVASLIEIGELPESPDWMEWGFSTPLEFTVDWRHRVNGYIDLRRNGMISTDRVISKFTRNADGAAILREEAGYLQDREAVAEEYGVAVGDLGTSSQPGDDPNLFSDEPPEGDENAEASTD